MGASAIPGIFLPFLIAYLANRFNKKNMTLLALSIMIPGLVAFSLSNSFSMLLAFRLISGMGAMGCGIRYGVYPYSRDSLRSTSRAG